MPDDMEHDMNETAAGFDLAFIEEGEQSPVLGPAYFDARNVAERAMAQFTAEHFKPLVDKIVDQIRDTIWTDVQAWLLSDTEMNLQGEMWRMVDASVEAILGGSQWALKKYALEGRHDHEKIRAAVAKYIPKELQDMRIADLEQEVAHLRERIDAQRRY
jgi:hypothetical protein